MKFAHKSAGINVDALSFAEFVAYGIQHGANISNGMPMSFSFNGHPVSHESDAMYLIVLHDSPQVHQFRVSDLLMVFPNGNLSICEIVDVFKEYSPVLPNAQYSCADAIDRPNRAHIAALEKQNADLLAALKFYANDAVYQPDSVGRRLDISYVARDAISALQPSTQEVR